MIENNKSRVPEAPEEVADQKRGGLCGRRGEVSVTELGVRESGVGGGEDGGALLGMQGSSIVYTAGAAHIKTGRSGATSSSERGGVSWTVLDP